MSIEEKMELLEDLMDLDEGTLEPTTVLEDIEEWDSLSKLGLVALAKKKFGKNMINSDFEQFHIVQDICDYLQ